MIAIEFGQSVAPLDRADDAPIAGAAVTNSAERDPGEAVAQATATAGVAGGRSIMPRRTTTARQYAG